MPTLSAQPCREWSRSITVTRQGLRGETGAGPSLLHYPIGGQAMAPRRLTYPRIPDASTYDAIASGRPVSGRVVPMFTPRSANSARRLLSADQLSHGSGRGAATSQDPGTAASRAHTPPGEVHLDLKLGERLHPRDSDIGLMSRRTHSQELAVTSMSNQRSQLAADHPCGGWRPAPEGWANSVPLRGASLLVRIHTTVAPQLRRTDRTLPQLCYHPHRWAPEPCHRST